MTLATEVLRFIKESKRTHQYAAPDGSTVEVPCATWQDVVLNFHPEAKDGDGWVHSPREVLAPHAPSLPPDAFPTKWPAEDALDFLLDKGTIYEPILGTVALIPEVNA